MGLDFSEVTKPDETPDPMPPSDDPTCEVCGTPLSYSGRGRKPKFCEEHRKSSSGSGSSSRGKAADVERACQTLDGLYTGIAFALMPVSRNAVEEWARQADALSQRNRAILASNKRLVDRINKGSEKGSTFAFFASHVIAVAPVIVALRADIASRAPAPDAGIPMGSPDNVTNIDPDAAFR